MAENYGNMEPPKNAASRVIIYADPKPIPYKFARFLLNDCGKDVMHGESVNGIVVRGVISLNPKFSTEREILSKYFKVAKSHKEYEDARLWVEDNCYNAWATLQINTKKEFDRYDYLVSSKNVTYAGSTYPSPTPPV